MNEPAERKCTNISSLFVCIGFVVLLFILVGYCGYYGNLDRLSKGYDNCGNICGRLNTESTFNQCGDHDKRDLPKVLVESRNIKLKHRSYEGPKILHYTCVQSCPPNYTELFNRCFQDLADADGTGAFEILSEDLIFHWTNIAAVCLIAFAFSYVTLILFRYAIKYIIWIVYCSFIGLMIAAGIFFLISGVYQIAALFLVFVIVSIFLLCFYRRRIQLVAKLFKEAAKALVDIPAVLFEPVMTFVSLLIAFFLFIYFMVVIETSGKLTQKETLDGEFQATFKKDGGMTTAEIVNVVAFIWFTQFLYGCQHFVIAGTISKWYFTRDKTKLVSPIQTTFSHLINFHLGSVCLGSMIITLVKILTMIAKAIQRDMQRSNSLVGQCVACCCTWLLEQFERILKYLVRNTYIIIAKEGTPFIVSARRAFDLIYRNLIDVVALNHFGDLVLVLARFFIVGIAGLFGYVLMSRANEHNLGFPLLISLIFAFLIAHCFISVFEMTVDTIFICFCIDVEENDGVERPYYMSDSLKKVFCELKGFSGGQFDFGAKGDHLIEQQQQHAVAAYDYPITSQGGYDPYQNQPQPSYNGQYATPYPPSVDSQFKPSYPPIDSQFAPTAPYPPSADENGYLLNKPPQSYATYYNNK